MPRLHADPALVFLERGYPAAVTAGVLVLLSRASGHPTGFRVAFGRTSLATAVPVASTTMVMEAAAALLLAVGLVKPADLMSWLTGPGAWFALLYQLAGPAWLGALVLIATRTTLGRGWLVSAPAGLLLLVVHGLPVALLIR